jgi:hypothetical protein
MRTIGEYIVAIVPRDRESNVPVEYCVFFALIALFIGIRGFVGPRNQPAFSAAAVSIPARPLRPVSSTGAPIETSSASAAAVASSPVCTKADSSLPSSATITPDLMPTTFRMMGNVVYLHAPTGKFLVEVGNLSSSEPGMMLDPGVTKAIGNEVVGPVSSQVNLANDDDHPQIHAIEDASIIRRPKSSLGDRKDTSEVQASEGRRGYKQLVRSQRVKIEPEQTYSPGEVAAALNLSYDSALRRMQKMKGVVDLGTPTRRYKRGKKKLRISGKNLLAFLRSKTVV